MAVSAAIYGGGTAGMQPAHASASASSAARMARYFASGVTCTICPRATLMVFRASTLPSDVRSSIV
ncbi:MAG: hypothetical protein JWM53_2053, partial [bacterium]|nr:hypothetical protein [bacterium]